MFSTLRSISRLRHISLLFIVSLGMTALVACGGGSGGSGSSSGTESGDESENTAPAAAITGPLDGDAYTYGDTITFTGSGTDAEDGDITGASLIWTSDLDGEVGTGASFTVSDLLWGDHTITLTATDSDAETGSDSIHISVKAWDHPDDFTDNISPDGQNAIYPAVAMDGNGNAVIVWSQNDGSTYQILKSEYRDGTWTHPSDISEHINPDTGNAVAAQVAMDNEGNAIITWQDHDGANNQIFKSEYRNGEWDHPDNLSESISPSGEDAFSPRVAMDDNGNAIITWYQYNGSRNRIYKSEYRDGEWTHPGALFAGISPNDSWAEDPQVAMDNNGNAVIAWQQYNGSSNRQIFMSEYRSGAWTHPTGLDDNISPDGQDAEDPQVAMDNNGNTIITWKQSDSAYERIFKSEYRNDEWVHPDDLFDNISPDKCNAYNPQVAMDDNGNAIIIWRQFDETNMQIFKSEYRSEAWDHPDDPTDNISPDGQDASDAPQVAMDNNGNAVITWTQFNDSSDYQIFMSEYRHGAWIHPNSLSDNISPDYGDYAGLPQVAMDDSGNAVITWTQYDNSDIFQIFISEYN